MSYDDDEEDDDGAIIEAEIVPPEVPGYLTLSRDLKDEGRLAYALQFCVSSEGVLHPEWIAVWSTINHVLKHGAFPNVGEITRLKIKK